jgi:tellurite resistance protein
MTSVDKVEDDRRSAETEFLLRCMIAMAAADGMLLGRELDVIADIYAGLTGGSIDRGEVAERFLQWQNDGSPSIGEIVGHGLGDVGEQSKERIFKAACRIMMSDGDVAETERRRLSEIASVLDMDVGFVIETLLTLR